MVYISVSGSSSSKVSSEESGVDFIGSGRADSDSVAMNGFDDSVADSKIWDIHDEGLDFYENHSTDITSTNLWVKKQFPRLVKHWQSSVDKGSTLHILAIGSGRGQKDAEILRQVKDHFSRVSYRVVEPNYNRLQDLQTRLVEKAAPEHVSFDIRLEKACTSSLMDKKFHLIHLLHVVAYIENAEEYLLQCYKQLQPNGVLLVQIDSDDENGLAFLDGVIKASNERSGGLMKGFLMTSQLENVLKKHSFNYEKFHYAGTADITECFRDDSSEGECLLHYLLLQENFNITELTKDTRKQILAHLRESSHVKMCGEKIVIQDEFDMFLIYKE
ncbi:histamine N-methyltransferase-like [Ptychodera flava]|uniref:histamine N-methyltransferase-like n=1 Tax=Ptychodera flava TaxID=63121 RepID=UPI00396A7E57